MTREQRKIEIVAKAIYNTNWKELPNGRFPPVWENTSEEVREWMRERAKSAIFSSEKFDEEFKIEQPGSLNPPVRLGQCNADVPGS